MSFTCTLFSDKVRCFNQSKRTLYGSFIIIILKGNYTMSKTNMNINYFPYVYSHLDHLWVYLVVRTCELFLCFTSLVSFTGSYTEAEPYLFTLMFMLQFLKYAEDINSQVLLNYQLLRYFLTLLHWKKHFCRAAFRCQYIRNLARLHFTNLLYLNKAMGTFTRRCHCHSSNIP